MAVVRAMRWVSVFGSAGVGFKQGGAWEPVVAIGATEIACIESVVESDDQWE